MSNQYPIMQKFLDVKSRIYCYIIIIIYSHSCREHLFILWPCNNTTIIYLHRLTLLEPTSDRVRRCPGKNGIIADSNLSKYGWECRLITSGRIIGHRGYHSTSSRRMYPLSNVQCGQSQIYIQSFYSSRRIYPLFYVNVHLVYPPWDLLHRVKMGVS